MGESFPDLGGITGAAHGAIGTSAAIAAGELAKGANQFTGIDAGFDGIFVSISNPCDVVCTALWHLTGYDPKKIIGSGCGLDSARLRTEISRRSA